MLEQMKVERSSSALQKWRHWLAVSACCVAALLAWAPRAYAADAEPDKTGAFQSTPTPASVPGYTKLDPKKMTPEDVASGIDAVAQSSSRNYFSLNFVWVLVAGFLVIFMQAGFALVETGLCRAKNAAHTMSMNFLVYALGMFGFFVSGFGLMCGGMNGTAIGGPVTLGGLPTLSHMFTFGPSVNGDHGWGLFGTTGFFLSGAGYDSAAIVMFLFMMAFMDTTATIVTGACAERWRFKSFFIFSILVGGFIYPMFGNWVWGGGWLAQLGYRLGFGHGAVDYAGSGVVHLQGGALAVITAWMIGPRIGKFVNGQPQAILPHHIPMVQLRHVHFGLRLVRLQRRQLARRHGRPHRHRGRQHHARRHGRHAERRALHVERVRQARSVDDVQQHARGPGRDHLTVRVRVTDGRLHHRRGGRRAGGVERVLRRTHGHR